MRNHALAEQVTQRFRVCSLQKDGNLLRVELEPSGGVVGDQTYALVNWPGTGSFRNISFAIEGSRAHSIGIGDEFILSLSRRIT